MATHRIEIPNWHPPMANDWVGKHWRVKHRLRKEATEFLFIYARRADVPKATCRRRVALIVTGWGHTGNFPDRDCFDKLLLDALTKSELIVDDSPKWLEGRLEVGFVRGPNHTTLILEDVDASNEQREAEPAGTPAG